MSTKAIDPVVRNVVKRIAKVIRRGDFHEAFDATIRSLSEEAQAIARNYRSIIQQEVELITISAC